MPATAIKISSALAEQARTAAASEDRSVAGQIEHWANIGKTMAAVLPGAAITAIKTGDSIEMQAEVAKALRILEEFRTNPDRSEMHQYLKSLGQPLYSVNPEAPSGDTIIQTLPDGTRRVGRMVNRQFVPVTS